MLQKFCAAATMLLAATGLSLAQTQTQPLALLTPSPVSESSPGEAPTPEPKKDKWQFTTAVDGYGQWSFQKQPMNMLTSFTKTTQGLAIGMATMRVDHIGEHWGATVDLGFGPRAREFSYNEDGITQAIKQAYVYYAPTDWLKLTAGTWATHVGYEVVDAALNKQYSMSYLFSYGPFSHTGAKAEASFGKHGFMVGLSNQTDYRNAPAGGKPYLIGQYSYAASDDWKIYANFVEGKRSQDSSRTYQYDLVVTGNLSAKWQWAFNASTFRFKKPNLGRSIDKSVAQNWWGVANYLSYSASDTWLFNWRSEYFSDQDQVGATAASTQGSNIWANTVSAQFKKGNFMLVPEFRWDHAQKDIFYKSDGFTSTKGSGTFLIAFVYQVQY
jgi:hypothetical protein